MSAIAGPYGLRAVKLTGDVSYSSGMHTYPLTANQTRGYFFGDPVGLIGGQPVPITATPTTTLNANSPIGIFCGAEWIDPIRGFVNSQYLPANLISGGATKVKLKIMDNPELVMQIQANGSVAATQIGLNCALVSPIVVGNTATGDSLVALDATTIATTATLGLQIYDFVYSASPSPGAGSMPGDAFTDVLVLWNFGVHRFRNAGGQ